MGLSALDTALSGLRVSQQQISVISTNVSNAATPGYTRKLLPQSTLSSQGVGVGVSTNPAIRNVDITLERDLWTQVSSVGELSVQQSYLQRIEKFHGAPADEISVAAEISNLYDSFASLADNPQDTLALASLVGQAQDTANKINDLSDLITTLRNDVQSEIGTTVNQINSLLEQIAETNRQIESSSIARRSVADLEDLRSNAVKELSDLIEISFFTRGDGTLVVQTNQGVELASDRVTPLYVTTTPISQTSYYPETIDGVYVGDPNEPSSVDITATSPGGMLGGLITLRDETFPKQTAQIDELAHKLAIRMDQQGLRLFTDESGNMPSDAAPDPTTNPVTPVSYVGFASRIQVNSDILDDHSLIQSGTANTDRDVQPGSNEVIRRIMEFGFGDVAYQQATGTIDMRAQATGGTDLQNWLGITSSNTYTAGRGLESFASVADLVTSTNGDLSTPTEEFQLTFEEPRTGLGPITITINLTNANAQPGANALEQIVAEIDAQIVAAGLPAGLTADASIGSSGEIILTSSGNITIDASFGATAIGESALEDYFGMSEGTYETQDPYFDVQVGNDEPVRIYIEPGDTEAELIDKLILNSNGDTYNAVGDTTGIEGLAFDEATFLATGELILRPGDNFDFPEFGGDLIVNGGNFTIDPASALSPDLNALGAGNGVNIISALFGSFNAGPPAQDVSPITSVGYESETDASLATPTTVSFRENLLGPGANISTNINGTNNVLDYARRIVNEHTQEIIITESRLSDEQSLHDVLETQLLNDSGVNIDEELANLIIYQTAFSASARVVTAVDEMFEELLRAI